jgi:hypothetical protein
MTSDQRDDPITTEIINKVSVYVKENHRDKWLATTKFLGIEDKTITARCLEVLRSVSNNDVAFYKIVDILAEDAQNLEKAPSYRRFMDDMWKNYLTPNENTNVEIAANNGWSIQKFFNFFKADPLEKAYNFLELKYVDGASNDVINSNFRRLALKCRPDTGGSYDDWYDLQYSMSFIKLSKGEF